MVEPMFDTETLAVLGLWGLFVAAFLAGTVIAFGSEAVLVAVLLLGASPAVVVAVATLGNVLGALTVVAIGRLIARGRPLEWPLLQRLARRVVPDDPEKVERGRRLVERWGPLALLLSWVPIIGDALVLVAGLTRLALGWVLFYLVLGKLGRYAALTWLVLRVGG